MQSKSLLNITHGIYRGAVDPQFKMQVRAGTVTGGADLTDLLALNYRFAHRNVNGTQVCIPGLVAVAVADLDQLAVAAGPACADYRSAGRGIYRLTVGTATEAEVCTGMAPVPSEAAGYVAAVDGVPLPTLAL